MVIMNLLTFLKRNKDSRKIFGQRELKIIEKQLWGVNLTQSERNRLSRDIRKKFEFIAKVIRFEEDFILKKGAEVGKLIGETKEAILCSKWFPRIKKIILFGSTTENKRLLKSDIDIAVLFDKIEKLDARKFRIEMYIDDKVDIQVYNVLPDKIKKEIDLKGSVIYERKN